MKQNSYSTSKKIKKTRLSDFDFLRAIIIFFAYVLHFNNKIDLGVFSQPVLFFHNYIFTIGGFFFFTTGYMSKQVYLPKFQLNKTKTTFHLLKKGIGILLLYFTFIFLMRIATKVPFQSSIIAFIFIHPFFAKVLFSFGILFCITPLILYLIHQFRYAALIILIILSILFIGYSSSWNIPPNLQRIIFDRSIFLYPILSTLITFFFGFIAASLDNSLFLKYRLRPLVLFSAMLIIVHIICLNFLPYKNYFSNYKLFTFMESVTPYLFIIMARYLLSVDKINHFINRPKLLCIGVNSLTFYVISSGFIGLLRISQHATALEKLSMFISIAILTYLFTYWHFNSQQYITCINKPLNTKH